MLDHQSYYHIVEAITDVASADYVTSLALRPVCRAFRAKVDANLGRHIRLERLAPPPSPPPFDEPKTAGHMMAVRRLVHEVDAADAGRILVHTAHGDPLPHLRPVTPLPSLPLTRALRTLAETMESTRVIDFRTNVGKDDRWVLRSLRDHGNTVDTLRFIGVNDGEFSLDDLRCRRMVGVFAVALSRATHSDWESFYPRGDLPMVTERLVLNVVLPRREEEEGIGRAVSFRIPVWQPLKPRGDWDMTFIFRPIETCVATSPAIPRTAPDLGALLNIAITNLDINRRRRYTLVGVEEVEWSRLGLEAPPSGTNKEQYFRDALEETVIPAMGMRKGMVDAEEIQSRIEFLSHSEYRERVGEDEYEGDMLPVDGLLARRTQVHG